MRLLQNTSEILPDIQVVIRKADEIRQSDARKNSGPISSLAKQQIGKRLKNFRSSINNQTRKISEDIKEFKIPKNPFQKPEIEKNEISENSANSNFPDIVPEKDIPIPPSHSEPDLSKSSGLLTRGRQSFKSLRVKNPFHKS